MYGYKPTLYSTNNKVPFKNQRFIGGRALVIDAYSTFTTSATVYADDVGCAWWAHQEGYNILAGDNHVAWMGDPQRRHMYWHKTSWITPEGKDTSGSASSHGGWSARTGSRVGAGAWAWHQFDVFLGIDTHTQ